MIFVQLILKLNEDICAEYKNIYAFEEQLCVHKKQRDTKAETFIFTIKRNFL